MRAETIFNKVSPITTAPRILVAPKSMPITFISIYILILFVKNSLIGNQWFCPETNAEHIAESDVQEHHTATQTDHIAQCTNQYLYNSAADNTGNQYASKRSMV